VYFFVVGLWVLAVLVDLSEMEVFFNRADEEVMLLWVNMNYIYISVITV
jgi:hypothetical protein